MAPSLDTPKFAGPVDFSTPMSNVVTSGIRSSVTITYDTLTMTTTYYIVGNLSLLLL